MHFKPILSKNAGMIKNLFLFSSFRFPSQCWTSKLNAQVIVIHKGVDIKMEEGGLLTCSSNKVQA